MPTRLLRDWTDSDRFDGISADAERLFVRLLMKADDYGRFHAEPRRLKAALFPLIDNLRQDALVRWLDELSTRQLVLLYESVDHRQLLAIPRFGQRLKQSVPKFPAPPGKPENWLPEVADCLPTSGKFPERPAVFGDVFGDGDVSGAPDGADGFEEAWKAYPKRPGNSKADALKAWKARAKEGHKPDVMAAGVKRYADYCRAQQTQPQFIKLAATFFGPGLHFQDAWKADAEPSAPVETVEAYQARMAREREASMAGVTAMPDSVRELAQRLRRTA
jgi:hypothetical protein